MIAKSKRDSLRELILFAWPLLIVMVVALLSTKEGLLSSTRVEDAPTEASLQTRQGDGKVVLVIIDSLREEAVTDHMPNLNRLRHEPTSAWLPVHTCNANFTVPCVQTILEGRQSPFAAGLNNFTGQKGGEQSFPGAVAHAKKRQRFISDFTLDSLYGRLADESLDVEKMKGNHLEHDLESIARVNTWLSRDEADVILLHLVGTDKVAHRKRPGHAEYAKHFASVDDALTTLYANLDPEKDHLFITGDHGHDEQGHHTHSSLLITRSPSISPLLRALSDDTQLEQPELTYLLSLAASVELTPDYEGRYLGLEAAASLSRQPGAATTDALDHFKSRQRAQFQQEGFTQATLEEQIQATREARAARPWHALARTSPLLALYLAWLLIMAARARGAKITSPRKISAALSVAVILYWAMGLWLPSAMSAVFAVSLLALLGKLLKGRLRSARDLALWLIAPLALVAIAGAFGPQWTTFFHSHGSFRWQTPAFFLGMIAIGAALSSIIAKHPIKGLPESMGALCLLGLPSGVYFYQVGSNFARGLAIGGIILTLWMLWRERARLLENLRAQPWAAVVFIAGSSIMLWQTAGGWEWHAGLARWLWSKSHLTAAGIYAAIGLASLSLLPNKRWRALHALLLTSAVVYSVGLAELGWAALTSAAIVPMTAISWLALTQDQKHSWRAPERSEEREGFLFMALFFAGCWTLLSGFFIGNFNFNFAFEFMSGVSRERDAAFWAFVLTYPKYALVLWPLSFALVAKRPERWPRVAKWLLLAMHAKILALLVQILCGPLLSTEKFYELAISELLFVFNLTLVALSGVMLAGAASRWIPTRARESTHEPANEETARALPDGR